MQFETFDQKIVETYKIKHEPCKRSWCYTIETCMQPTATSTLVPILLPCTLTVTVLYSLNSLYSINYVS